MERSGETLLDKDVREEEKEVEEAEESGRKRPGSLFARKLLPSEL